jgi:hypothetical protein
MGALVHALASGLDVPNDALEPHPTHERGEDGKRSDAPEAIEGTNSSTGSEGLPREAPDGLQGTLVQQGEFWDDTQDALSDDLSRLDQLEQAVEDTTASGGYVSLRDIEYQPDGLHTNSADSYDLNDARELIESSSTLPPPYDANPNTGSPRLPELQTDKERFAVDFPDGYDVQKTSARNLECGLHAIAISTQFLNPLLDPKASGDLEHRVQQFRDVIKSRIYQQVIEGIPGMDNVNNLTADQIALVLQIWGRKNAMDLQLGTVMASGTVFLLSTTFKNPIRIWIHNDSKGDMSSKVINHWEGITRRAHDHLASPTS